MKKFLVMCGLALALSSLAQQQASAWTKFNFSAGINISYEGGNNCLNWCGFTSGPAPFGYGGYPVPYAPAFAYGGYPQYDGYAAAPSVQSVPQAVAQPATQTPVRQAHYTYGQTNYAPTSYYPQNYGYGYGSSAPSYWYGN